MLNEPFHDGEIRAQEVAGERHIGARTGAIIGNTIHPNAQAFLERQSMLVLSSVDPTGQPWASALFGAPGFVRAEDARHAVIDLAPAQRLPDDALWRNLAVDNRLGLLAIEFATRRRMRINGDASRPTSDTLRIAVREAYGNCPKHIQRREAEQDERNGGAVPATRQGDALPGELLDLIRRADTFFVATANPGGNVDASHRGGEPGFIEVTPDGRLQIPDYSGNSMFNTLGNLLVEPRAGLLFIDFDRSRLLQIAGAATIEWNASGGADRFWTVAPTAWVETSLPSPIRWRSLDASPHNPGRRPAA